MSPVQGVPSQHPHAAGGAAGAWGQGLLAMWGFLVQDSHPFPLALISGGGLVEGPPWSLSFPKSCPSPSPQPWSKQVGETQHPGAVSG